MTIYMIAFGIDNDSKWVPTGTPCYTLAYAEAKLKRYKAKNRTVNYRLIIYVPKY